MQHGKELRVTPYAMNPMFGYLAEKDRYLFAANPPTHRFNVIGTGLNGMEHIRVTKMEGRAAIHGVFDASAAAWRARRSRRPTSRPVRNGRLRLAGGGVQRSRGGWADHLHAQLHPPGRRARGRQIGQAHPAGKADGDHRP